MALGVARLGEGTVSELVERVIGAADLADACSLVLEAAVAEGGFRRAAAIVDTGSGLTGVVHDAPRSVVTTFHLAQDAVPPELLEALQGQTPVTFSDSHLWIPELKFTSYLVLPLGGLEGRGMGAVVAEADRVTERVKVLANALARCGPALARCAEVEALRRRSDELEHQRALLLAMVNTLPDPVLLTDADNDILVSNRRADGLFTASADDSAGRRHAVEINTLLFSSFLTQSVVSHDGAGRELNLVDPEFGSDLFFEVISIPAVSALDPRGSVISVLRDITDLRRALAELEDHIERARLAEIQARRESERLNVIIENAGEPILVTDPASNIMLMNIEAERLFDITPDASGTPTESVIRTNDTKFSGLMSDFLMQPVQRRAERLDLVDPDGARRVPIEVVSTKILNRRGEPTAVVSVLHDLTQSEENEKLARELRKFNEELEHRIVEATRALAERNEQLEWQRDQLERASRLKSQFLATMSHEFRTPINAMVGYTSLLRERIYGDLSSDQDLALEKTQAASRHLLDLVNDILDLSKIEAGEVDIAVSVFQLGELVEEISRTIEPLLRKKPLAYRVEAAAGLPTLRTDRTKLQQVLLNLLSNAIKFTHQGAITLRARGSQEKAGFVVMEVEDTGIGIKPEHLEAIFEDFRQVDQSSTREYGGTGLGLSISRKLLSLLGGSITVQSTYGRGSTFSVELPIVLEPGKAVTRTLTAAPPRSGVHPASSIGRS